MSKKLTKTLKSALTNITSGLQTGGKNDIVPRKRTPWRRRFTWRRRAPTVNNPSWGRALPAAYASHVRPRLNVIATGENTVRVSGCDLVYPLPRSIETGYNSAIFAVIPSNPAYWTGTRVAQFAPAYMNYRPIAMTFSYIPQVAVTQSGTVFMGTLWNGATPLANIQQSLFTSNGGCLTQCYVPCDTTIKLGSNLQQNLFTMCGSLSPTTSPFIFMAGVRGSEVVPGYFYVTYTFEFKNPIGQTWNYGRTEVRSMQQLGPTTRHQNSSLVILNQAGDLGPGTILDYETTGTYYNGSPYPLASNVTVIEFYNSQEVENPAEVVGIIVDGNPVSLLDFYPISPGQTSPAGKNIILTHVHDSDSDFNYVFDVETQQSVDTKYDRWFYSVPQSYGEEVQTYSRRGPEVAGEILKFPNTNIDEHLLRNVPDSATKEVSETSVSSSSSQK